MVSGQWSIVKGGCKGVVDKVVVMEEEVEVDDGGYCWWR